MNEATETAIQALQLPDEAFHSASDAAFDAVTKAIAPPSDTPPPGAAAATPDTSPSGPAAPTSDTSGQPAAVPTPHTPPVWVARPASGDAAAAPDAAPPNPEAPPIFALGLPRVVDVEHKPTIPGALALRFQGQRRWEVDLPQNLCFIIVDLHSGVAKTVTPLLPDKRMATPRPSRSGPPPSLLNRDATSYGVERFTLPDAFGPDWPSSAYAVTAIDYDWVTNTAVVERRPKPDLPFEPFRTASAFLEPATPATPDQHGVSLAVAGAMRAGSPILIEVRVAAPRLSVVLAHSTEEPDDLVLVADVLLVQLDVTPPLRISLAAPVAVTGDTVSAAFSFDLARRPEGANLAGDYQVYLVSGRTVTGPAALTVASR